MKNICVKLRQRENKKYRKMLSSDETIFPEFDPENASTSPYTPGATLQDDDWFCITNAKSKEYSIDLFSEPFSTVDMDSLTRAEFDKIDYLFVVDDRFIFFQNVFKSKLVSQKRIVHFGEEFVYKTNCAEIIIRDLPDAIYDKTADNLYFRKLESITSIFRGIDMLYREATQEETDSFLANDFISLKNGFSGSKVKTANRKRIALAAKTLSELGETDRKNIFAYIGEYCPDLKAYDNAFEVGSENELKMLLYGIEQRFYTTPVGGEKRLANSVITLNQGGQV